jgi:membrane-associated phospholipid phosphatase
MLKDMDWAALIIRIMADWVIVAIALTAVVMLLCLPEKKVIRAFLLAVLTLAIAYVTAKLLAGFYTGERPFVYLGVEPGAWAPNNPGFPSSHALFAFALAFIVWATTHNKVAGVTLFVLSCIVALGRVMALVHTPLDVMAGACIAFLAAVAVYRERLFKTH